MSVNFSRGATDFVPDATSEWRYKKPVDTSATTLYSDKANKTNHRFSPLLKEIRDSNLPIVDNSFIGG